VPQPIRAALRLQEGDGLAYEIDGSRVILTKASNWAPKALSAFFPNGTATPTRRLMLGFERGDVFVELSAESDGLG
jgi:antitoxin PrlF